MAGKLTRFFLTFLLLLVWNHAANAATEPIIRVGLKQSASSIEITFPTGGEQRDEKNRRVKVFRPGEKFSWQISALTQTPKTPQNRRSPSKKAAKSSLLGRHMKFYSKKEYILLNNKGYRGMLEVSFTDSGVDIVNYVPLETYLRGVVGSEISSLSPSESLKAQAVIARTWVLANRNKHGKDGFDVCDKEHCQVYGGVKAERPTVDLAISSTRGIVIYCDGAPISAMYHATCGGMTSNNEDVYGSKPTRYLRRVRCNYCQGAPKYRWDIKLNVAQLKNNLAKEGFLFEKLYAIETISPTPLDRVTQVKMQTDGEELRIKGTTFRRLMNLPSTTFVITDKGNTKFQNLKTVQQGGLLPILSPGSYMILNGRLEVPSQLIIQSADGIKRVRRPQAGWTAIGIATIALDRERETALSLNSGASSRDIIIHGRGYGHQLGLCQEGAVELGKRGWSYRQILALYYSNISLCSLQYAKNKN